MKLNIYLLAFFITYLCDAQINLEQTHVQNGNDSTIGNRMGYLTVFKTHQGIFYYTQAVENGMTKISIYDQNLVFYKAFNIPYISTIYFVTDKLFNNDDLIEFLYVNGIHTKLVNENGELLYTWSDRWNPKLFMDDNNNFKLIVYNQSSSPTNTTTSDIYGLGGTLSVSQQDMYLDKSLIGYPNPTDNTITISNGKFLVEGTKVEVFDIAGKKLMEKEIMSGQKEIIIDITSYSTGCYIYKINGETHKFIKR